jgi:anti-anti-sigma factor
MGGMELLRRRQEGDEAEVELCGRLDGYWTDHVARDLDEMVRGGAHRLWLDLSRVTYLSSVGIGLLVRFRRELDRLGGSFKVINPSEVVKEVLTATRLHALLVGEAPGQRGRPAGPDRAPRRGETQELNGIAYETFTYPAERPLRCRSVGNASLLLGCRRFGPESCPAVALGGDSFAVGVGALGQSFEDCQGRFGEFLAVAGAASYLPTDGTNVPDYFLLGGSTVPRVRLCYGLVFEGHFARLARFEARRDAGTVTLTELVEAGLELAQADCVGLVMVAESAGLMGATLRRSPALDGPPDDPFAHPRIRDWLSFTGEHVARGATTVVVGVAARGDGGALAPLLRPLGAGPSPVGHFHAAAFSYRTLPRGEIDLQPTVAALFEQQSLQSILHLLGDYRETAGMGESEFVRGACWVGPIAEVNVAAEGVSA